MKSAVSTGITHTFVLIYIISLTFCRVALLKKRKKAKINHNRSQSTNTPRPSEPVSNPPVETTVETAAAQNLATVGA